MPSEATSPTSRVVACNSDLLNPTEGDTMSDTRKPTRFLNYPGRPAHALNYPGKVGQIVGPNTMGEHWIAVSTDYDGERTRVGFAIATPADLSQKENR